MHSKNNDFGFNPFCKVHKIKIPLCSCKRPDKYCTVSSEREIRKINPFIVNFPMNYILCTCPKKCISTHHAVSCMCHKKTKQCKIFGHDSPIENDDDNSFGSLD
jgi:hypothetical protein